MLDFTMPDFQTLLIYVIPLIFAITIHEVAHGWVANQRGDSTARMLGRLTLNPVKHIDPPHTTDFAVMYLPDEGLFWREHLLQNSTQLILS
jgi:Zn-dependent protease